MEHAIIEFSGVTLRYRSGITIGPLDFRVGPRELVLVGGPNGAGKSTLLGLVAGSLLPDRGRVTVTLRRAQVAVLPQHHTFHPDLPVRVEDVVGFGALAHGWLRTPDRTVCKRALERVGAGELGGRLFRELSGGQRQLVQLARLLAQGGRLWLLDEPLAGLDSEWRRRVAQVLDSLHRDDGIAMLLVSHHLDAVPPACRRMLRIEDGRIRADGPPVPVVREVADA
jgi:ABC-type Mn2+/Zn2+ transport system ATPase subunit